MKNFRIVKGKKHYPSNEEIVITGNTVSGNRWEVRQENGRYVMEYDSGELAEKFIKTEITEIEFNLIKEGKLLFKDLQRKYVFGEQG